VELKEWNGRDPEPGDVLLEDDGDRSLVVTVETVLAYSQLVRRGCGCGCMDDGPEETQVTIWVAAPEPVEVLTPGGGITKVAGLTEWFGEPEKTQVLRPIDKKSVGAG
jgi:hypothetical protein